MSGSVVEEVPTSLYRQVTDDLLRQIMAGEICPGAMLPTETMLCARYGVSRITVRRALADLAARGLVVRRAGVGTVVTGRRTEFREFHLTGFLDERRIVDVEILCNLTVQADEAAKALGLPADAPVRHIQSLNYRGTERFTMADAFTAERPGETAEEQDYRTALPSADAFGIRLGRRIERAEQELDAVAADDTLASGLGIPLGTPVIRARRTYYARGGEPVRYVVVRYHPRHYRFVVDLIPRSGGLTFEASMPAQPAQKKRQKARG
jgi:GntR family transcriptional regulator